MLELDFLIVTDAFEEDLVDVIAQPFGTYVVVKNRKQKWTPDFLIRRRSGPDELVEIKHLSWLYHQEPAKRALARARCEAMETAAREQNCLLRLVTEDQIRVQPRLANAKLIHRHCCPFVPKAQLVAALGALSTLGQHANIPALAIALGQDLGAHALALAIRLERLGHILIDRKNPYTPEAQFTKILTPVAR